MTLSASPPAPAAASSNPTLRLYVSPLAPSLLPTILPPHIQSTATDITYHAPQTFPQNTYGYITLSTPEALKLKTKLHGSILRGVKMRVEEARPDKRRKRTADDESIFDDATTAATEAASAEGLSAEKLARRERRRLRKASDNGALPAIELPEGRSVKRGWSQSDAGKDSKAKRSKRKDKEADKGEMVFRTQLPPNRAASSTEQDLKSLSKKSKREGRTSKPGKAVEVTEFDKTTKYPTFIRDSHVSADAKRTVEFVDGKGWVDEDGNIVEPVPESRSKRRKHRQATPELSTQANGANGSSNGPRKEIRQQHSTSPGEATSPNDAASSPPGDLSATPTPNPPVVEAIAQPKPIHPLEALFKRPAPKAKGSSKGVVSATHRPAPIETSFSFFSSDQDDDESGQDATGDGALRAPPQTPFTRHDMEMRGIRSAAPTPDTAAIGRRFSMPWRRSTNDSKGFSGGVGDEEDDDDEDEDEDEDHVDNDNDDDDDNDLDDKDVSNDDDDGGDEATKEDEIGAQTGSRNADGTEQNEFEKHFWQHRGDYNRAWKARKREVRKEVRQSENRKRGVGGQ